MLERWHRSLFTPGTGMGAPEIEAAAAAIEELVTTSRIADPGTLSREAIMRWRLATAARAASERGLDPLNAGVRAAICRLIPLADPSLTVNRVSSETRPVDSEANPVAAPPNTKVRPKSAQPQDAIDLDNLCALPFLMLGPLRQAGYLDAAVLALADERLLSAYAAALAMKVLPPPSRGWLRDGRASATAAVFAGLNHKLSDSEFSEVARRAEPALLVMDDVVLSDLKKGHIAGTPFFVVSAGSERLVVDADGGVVLSAADDDRVVGAALRETGGEWVAVLADAATPGLMRALAEAGVAFVTDARPGRGERWKRVAGTPDFTSVWWTSSSGPPPRAVLSRIESRGDLTDRTTAGWRALADRPAVPRAQAARFERSLSLAAAYGLGTIAWALWRDRGPSDPLLALERLATLDVRVRFDRAQMRVGLPLGMRHHDLRQHGVLADVPDVPWLGGRTVVFNGG
jgi:hypothetical protein